MIAFRVLADIYIVLESEEVRGLSDSDVMNQYISWRQIDVNRTSLFNHEFGSLSPISNRSTGMQVVYISVTHSFPPYRFDLDNFCSYTQDKNKNGSL
jgi:hypothetical protein